MEHSDLLSRIWALMMAAEETEPKRTEHGDQQVKCSANDMDLFVEKEASGQCNAVLSWMNGSSQETFTACLGKDSELTEALAELWYKVCKEYRIWR